MNEVIGDVDSVERLAKNVRVADVTVDSVHLVNPTVVAKARNVAGENAYSIAVSEEFWNESTANVPGGTGDETHRRRAVTPASNGEVCRDRIGHLSIVGVRRRSGRVRYRRPVRTLSVSPEVALALDEGRPVVALESTIISHGLPRPRNREAAIEFEQILRDKGVTPATVAVINGIPTVGLDADGLATIADADIAKASVRDLPVLLAKGLSGATTVAATAHIAAAAGVRLFATGGLGGVHRGANDTFDESADLSTLAVTNITVVSAGVKSVLDIAATLERLETLSVPVVGYGTTAFPAFWLRESGFTLDWSADDAAEVAAIMKSHDDTGNGQGIVVANPIPPDQQWDPAEHDRVLAEAFAAAEAAGVRGKAVTPFLLGYIVDASKGRSLEVNLDLARNNIRVAGDIAIEWSRLNA